MDAPADPNVTPAEPAASDDLTPLPPRARLLLHLRGLSRLAFVWSPMCVVLGAVLATQVGFLYALAVAAAVWATAFVASVWGPSLAYDRWGYRLGAGDLRVESGVLVRYVVVIPLGRVQYVDVRQGLLDQLLGLATLRVHTASGTGVDAAIPGLELDEAERLRGELVARAKGDDGV